jgi:hypothetical protein
MNSQEADMGNTSMVHTDRALIKVIEDPAAVRLKICPRTTVPEQEEMRRGMPADAEVPEYHEIHGSLETDLTWEECNILIRHIRTHRDRVYGRAE